MTKLTRPCGSGCNNPACCAVRCLHPLPERLLLVLRKLTYNGAVAVRNTVSHPHDEIPRLLNGSQGRLFTGLGKWTSLAARGVENNIRACGLLEDFDAQPLWRPGLWEKPWIVDVLNDLGMEMARYLDRHWDSVVPDLRDLSGRDR